MQILGPFTNLFALGVFYCVWVEENGVWVIGKDGVGLGQEGPRKARIGGRM
jgi:hypothetical protein